MISKFFIERPVLSNVIAILMILIGGVCLFRLAVAQYPDIVPPTVQVTTRYPGASAKTVIDTVALPIEQQANALLVPDVALGSDQSGRYVLVVNGENVVEQRKVQTGPVEGELRVIDSGLKPDDRVVTAGLLRAIPGQKVDPQLKKIEAPPASAK